MTPCNNIQKLPNIKYPVLPGTWVFNLRQQPDGSPLKFKQDNVFEETKKLKGWIILKHMHMHQSSAGLKTP